MAFGETKRRVVITGIGVITPVGNTVQDFWQSLVGGKSGAAPITLFDASTYDTHFACEVKGFDPLRYVDRKLSQRADRFTLFGLAAAQDAIKDSGLNFEQEDRERIGVIFGSGIGGMWTYHKQFTNFVEGGPGRISPFFIPMLIPDIAAGRISMIYGLKGPNYSVVSACATSSHAIGDAFMLIQRNDADVMVTGGGEASICPMGIGGFNALKALSTRNDAPEKASRPFDNDRDGFVMGEGSGIIILEELHHAIKRGATIYAELGGIGFTADAHHITEPAPGGEGAVRSMRIAIRDAGLSIDDIDYVNTHGTSTPPGDRCETAAIKTVFGERAKKIAVNSTKSITGHLLGAAGAVESVATIMSIRSNTVHPTINQETPDPECDLNYIPNVAQERTVDVAISNTFGFGGHNATLLFKRYQEH
ncbi:MAG TPA: beta-ketoacyl-ACP synthase II [Bacteroidota bacterium]|nr:beta-ketoacyl-ACP synthase II [Bacteroidota bacterium]